MKVAIIGANITGLSCAHELERLGVYADVFERDCSIGWAWCSVNYWPEIFYRGTGDLLNYLEKRFDIILKPNTECKHIILKSPNQTANIKGRLGYCFIRGKNNNSMEAQLARDLRLTSIHFNRNVDYKELINEYDWVVVATGNDAVARELGVWEDAGLVRAIGGLVAGSFDPHSSYLYLDKDYAGSGYARLSPFSSSQAIVGLYVIGGEEFELERRFSSFLSKEKLEKLEFVIKLIYTPFTTGKVIKYRIGNVLLAGRAAGLTERLLGVGAPAGIISGVLAARAIVRGLNYDKLIKPLYKKCENISSFRKVIEKFDNDDYDKLIAALDTPGIKQLVYNSKIDYTDIFGSILKHVTK